MVSGLKERFYKIEFIPYLVLGLALFILVLFIAYPLSKVLLNSFLKTDDVFSLQNLNAAASWGLGRPGQVVGELALP